MKLWIADVDGVFTDFRAQPNAEAIALSAKIGTREPFGYVTGRGAPWLTRNLLPVLTEMYRLKTPVLGIACAEYGGVILRWKNDEWHELKSPLFRVLDEFRDDLRKRIAEVPGVFFDEDKHVMISVEARHDMRMTHHDVVEEGLQIAEDILRESAKNHPELEYQRTTYACDLVPNGMNKEYGASYILDHAPPVIEEVHLIGDAPSDLLLAHPFRDRNTSWTFHYVGDPAKLSDQQRQEYAIQETSQRYDLGTIEVLRQHQ